MCEIHQFRWLLLSLLDDLLNGPNEEVIHVVSFFAGESHQQRCKAWKSSWTHEKGTFLSLGSQDDNDKANQFRSHNCMYIS